MKYSVSIDVPTLDEGLRFYGEAFGFVESARPIEGYAVLKCGDAEIDFYVHDFEETLGAALRAGAQREQKFEGGDHPPAAFCSDPFGNRFCILGRRPDKS